MSIIRDVFDFLFPILPFKERNDKRDTIKTIEAGNIKGDNSTLQKKAQVAKQYYDEEKERLKTIERKASMFITSSGFLGTVIIGTANILIAQKEGELWFKVLLVIALFFIVTYMVGTACYSIKALERATYNRPDPTAMIELDKGVDFEKKAIADMLNSTIYNKAVTNRKMDFVVLVQRCFKRLMLSILAFVFVLLIYVLDWNASSAPPSFCDIRSIIDASLWNLGFIVCASVLILGNLVIGTLVLVKVLDRDRGRKKAG